MIKLLGAPVVEEIQKSVREQAERFLRERKRKPKLAVVLVGDHPASVIYTRKKGEAAIAVGMEHESIVFPATATPSDVKAAIDQLNADPHVDGILIQRPLPHSFREEEVLHWVTPEKDVDAFHPENVGRLHLGLDCFVSCTPAGVMEILDHYGVNPSGKVACVIGRSSIVGKPMAALLLQSNATVLHTHSKTQDIRAVCRTADIVIVAVGKPEMVDSSYLKPGAVVIDVGINRIDDPKSPKGTRIVGDVNYEDAAKVASAITPVPGGVGPMTIAMLLQNTMRAAERRG